MKSNRQTTEVMHGYSRFFQAVGSSHTYKASLWSQRLNTKKRRHQIGEADLIIEVYQSRLTHPSTIILYQPSTALKMLRAIRRPINLKFYNDHLHHLIHLVNGYKHYFHLAGMT